MDLHSVIGNRYRAFDSCIHCCSCNWGFDKRGIWATAPSQLTNAMILVEFVIWLRPLRLAFENVFYSDKNKDLHLQLLLF